MKTKDLLFSWKELECGSNGTLFFYCTFRENFGLWKQNDFIECLHFNHSNNCLEELDEEGGVRRSKQILFGV